MSRVPALWRTSAPSLVLDVVGFGVHTVPWSVLYSLQGLVMGNRLVGWLKDSVLEKKVLYIECALVREDDPVKMQK